jgi:hypothetical protein
MRPLVFISCTELECKQGGGRAARFSPEPMLEEQGTGVNSCGAAGIPRAAASSSTDIVKDKHYYNPGTYLCAFDTTSKDTDKDVYVVLLRGPAPHLTLSRESDGHITVRRDLIT